MTKLRSIGRFALTDFGPVIAFFVANHFWGLRAALIASLAFTITEITRKVFSKEKISAFFVYSAVISLTFGAIDVYLKKSVFFKYEASLTNIFTGFFFGATVFGQKSLIQEFAEQRMNGRPVTADHVYFFKLWTIVWAAYFFVKAGVYAWIARKSSSLEQFLIVRTIVGNVSLYALMGGSIFGSKPLFSFMKQNRLLPSTRTAADPQPAVGERPVPEPVAAAE